MATEQEEIPENIAAAITEISERATLLIRDEIDLARAEISAKIGKLVRGTVIGLAAGMFVVVAVFFVLIGLAWLAWYELFPAGQYFWGFFVVAGALLVLRPARRPARREARPPRRAAVAVDGDRRGPQDPRRRRHA